MRKFYSFTDLFSHNRTSYKAGSRYFKCDILLFGCGLLFFALGILFLPFYFSIPAPAPGPDIFASHSDLPFNITSIKQETEKINLS